MRAEEIREAVRAELEPFEKRTSDRFDSLESSLATGLDGTPGLIERARVIDARVSSLEKADATRNRTVCAAVISVIAALAHTVWQAISIGSHPSP